MQEDDDESSSDFILVKLCPSEETLVRSYDMLRHPVGQYLDDDLRHFLYLRYDIEDDVDENERVNLASFAWFILSFYQELQPILHTELRPKLRDIFALVVDDPTENVLRTLERVFVQWEEQVNAIP